MPTREDYYAIALDEIGADTEAIQALPPAEGLYELNRALKERGLDVEEVDTWIWTCSAAHENARARRECFEDRVRAATAEPPSAPLVYLASGALGLGAVLTASYLMRR